MQIQRIGFGLSSFSAVPFQAPVNKKSLGQAEQAWYARAKAAVAEYDNLWDRAQKIADKEYRDQVGSVYHGDPNNPESPLSRRNAAAYSISEAESYTPLKYEIFGTSSIQNRVEMAEGWNEAFRSAVETGEETYGVLSNPEVVQTRVVAEKKTSTGWVLPVVITAGVVAIGALLFGLE